MRNVKIGLLAVVVAAVLGGTALLNDLSFSGNVAAQERAAAHWRWHDNHWSYWYPADNRWYYTDGSNWYYNDNGQWSPYRFDQQFGRTGFERGAYAAPGAGEKLAVPRHQVYRQR